LAAEKVDQAWIDAALKSAEKSSGLSAREVSFAGQCNVGHLAGY